MMPQAHLFLIILSAVLFFLAAATAWPRPTPAAGWSMCLGWAGAFCFVLAGLVSG